MGERKDQTITVTDSDGNSFSQTLSWEATIDEWMTAFRVILFWLTFHFDLIKTVIPSRANDEKDKG